MITLPTTIRGDWHNSIWGGIEDIIQKIAPDLIWCWEEWHTFFTWQLLRLAKRYNAKFIAGGWENIHKQYPSPYRDIEHDVLSQADLLQAGNTECKEVLIDKGTDPNRIIVLPQVGVSTNHF